MAIRWPLTAKTRADLKALVRRADRVLFWFGGAAVALTGLAAVAWHSRAPYAGFDLAPAATTISDSLTVTWFGVSTLLFDDGKTQILIDGFISRPTVKEIATGEPVSHDAATINYWLHEYGVWRLAAIIPSHSHFDHAMDIGAIANRSAASIIGSKSAAAIGRGSGVPEDQIVVTGDNAEYTFGEFTVRLIETPHAPIGVGGGVPFAGTIDAPLEMPAPVAAFRAGRSYSILVAHPSQTTLVHTSAGVSNSALESVRADTVFLGLGMLGGLGADYVRRYWISTVTTSGADRVVAVHFDYYSQPFGDIEFPPTVIDNVPKTLDALRKLRDRYDKDTEILLPEFGMPIALDHPEPEPGTTT